MARRGEEDPRVTEAELKESAAKVALSNAQIQSLIAEADARRQQLGIEREKVGVSREQIASAEKISGSETMSKEKLGKLAAAINILDLTSKEEVARGGDTTQILDRLAGRVDIPVDTLARTFASAGRPELYNAQAVDKATKREAFVKQMIPALQSAKSDTEREKKFKSAMEQQYPGSFQQGVALAYPDPKYPAPTFEPELYKGPVTQPATGGGGQGGGTGALLSQLLGQSGVVGDRQQQAPPQTQGTTAYGPGANALIRHGTIVGGPKGYDLNVNTGQYIPSDFVGSINGRLATDVIAEGAMRRGVSPEDERSRTAYNKLLETRGQEMTGVPFRGTVGQADGVTYAQPDISKAVQAAYGEPGQEGLRYRPAIGPEAVYPEPTGGPSRGAMLEGAINANPIVMGQQQTQPVSQAVATGRPDLFSRLLLAQGPPPWVNQEDIAARQAEAARRAEEEARRRALALAQQNR